MSPLTYVRPGLPPILSIQGDADPTVPYSHSVRLQEALEKANVPHQLVTIAGGKHGMFTGDEYVRIYGENPGVPDEIQPAAEVSGAR